MEKYQFGVRLGGWSHQGTSLQNHIDDADFTLDADYPATNAFIEGFYVQRLSAAFGFEISVAAITRGEVNVLDKANDERTFGTLALYPIRFRGILYPLPTGLGSFRPYLAAGVGMIVGTHSVQFANTYYYRQPETKFTFDWTVGGGLEFAVSPAIALEASVGYQPVHFGNGLLFEKDFNGLSITLGGKYLLGSRKAH